MELARAKAGQITLEQAKLQLDYLLSEGKWVSWDEAVERSQEVTDVRWKPAQLEKVFETVFETDETDKVEEVFETDETGGGNVSIIKEEE